MEYLLIGKPLHNSFSPLRLPANKDALRRFFYSVRVQQLPQQKSVNQTCSEIINIWKKVSHGATPGYSCFQTEKTGKKKINTQVLIVEQVYNKLMPSRKCLTIGKLRKSVLLCASILLLRTLESLVELAYY